MKRGTPEHPKTYNLAKRLRISHRDAIGLLELLFHFCSQFTPRGNIGKYGDDRIAAALEWSRRPSDLIRGLIDTGWVDEHPLYRLVTHDWAFHIDRATAQRLSRNGENVITVNQSDSEKVCPQSETQTSPHPPPLPEPVPTTTTPRAARVADSEWPETDAAVRGRYQTADGLMVRRIVESAVQAYFGVESPRIPELSDHDIAAAVAAAATQSPKQTSAGLFLKTVPTVIASWAKHGRSGAAMNGHGTGPSLYTPAEADE